ncbi:MAG: hypothetical protein ACRDPA_24555, partial [Solirubrobacteraceae bacterium]
MAGGEPVIDEDRPGVTQSDNGGPPHREAGPSATQRIGDSNLNVPTEVRLGRILPARWREQLRRSVANRSRGLTGLSLIVGVGSGLGAVAFRYMILGVTYLFTGHRDYSAAGHATNPLAPGLGIWFVAFAPVVGGLIYGPLVARFAPEARGHGVP